MYGTSYEELINYKMTLSITIIMQIIKGYHNIINKKKKIRFIVYYCSQNNLKILSKHSKFKKIYYSLYNESYQ